MQWVIPEKIHTPTTEGTIFLPPPPPHPPKYPKLLQPSSPQDFQVQRPPPPPPIWISIKLLDTVILLNTQCRRILLGT